MLHLNFACAFGSCHVSNIPLLLKLCLSNIISAWLRLHGNKYVTRNFVPAKRETVTQ